MIRPRACIAALALCAMAAIAACNDRPLEQRSPDAGAEPGGLTPEQAAQVVAKVGDKTITLGDYAASLERMDQFDRLRYQTKERRRELLQEIIDVELLSEEAKRRGLDKDPETADVTRQILRDAVLAEARAGLPAPAEIPAEEVRTYYEQHADKFREPERRRVGAIVMTDRKDAAATLKDALKITTPAQWGDLFYKHSATAPKQRSANAPVDLAGDLGVVGPLDDPRGANAHVPEAVREAVFQLHAQGSVADHLIEAEGKLYIVRLVGVTEGHTRALAEAERSIRVALIQEKMQAKEDALEARLRQKFPVEVDERALASVRMPPLDAPEAPGGGMPSAAPSSSAPAPSQGAPASSGSAPAPSAGAAGSPHGGK